jgi:hypothetical protein
MSWRSEQRNILLSNRKQLCSSENNSGKSYLNPAHQIISSFQDFRLQLCTQFTTHFLHLILLNMCTFHRSKNANYESPRYARFYSLLLLRVSYKIQTLSSILHSKNSSIYRNYWGFVLCPLSGILFVIWNTEQSPNIHNPESYTSSSNPLQSTLSLYVLRLR